MKQFNKLVAILLIASGVLGVSGCSNKIDLVDSSKIGSNSEIASNIILADQEIDTKAYTLKAPEGWKHTVHDTNVLLEGGKGKNNTITVAFIPEPEMDEVDINEYIEVLENKLILRMKEVDLETQVKSEAVTLPSGEAGVFTVESPLTSQSIQGWVASGSLTQAQIDEVGGEEEFIAKNKAIQIHIHILTDKGMFMMVSQSINEEESTREYSHAVANTIIVK